MKLFYTKNSPYSRVARVVALSSKLPVDHVEVSVRESATEILKFNPTAKVPALELTNGIVLSETRLICEYFESIGAQSVVSKVDDHNARHWEGVVSGFLDGIAVWVREARRSISEQSPGILVLEKNRCLRCLSYFDVNWHCKPDMTMAAIMLFSALDLMDKRDLLEWKLHYPALFSWYVECSKIPVMIQTAPCSASVLLS